MAPPIPEALKKADIQRFILRAAQLEKYKPVISYWCEYFVVNRILGKGLHTEGDDCMTFTTTLMDKLEKVKTEQPDDAAIHDDMAAQAYVEQFALETFQRGDNAMRSNKATAQTADTFLASAAFLELLSIWQNPLEEEISKKIKYAKLHSLRIVKALKAGEDPNLTNPVDDVPMPTPGEIPALDPNDPEVRKIQNLQPSVEDVPDHSRPVSALQDMEPEPTGPAQPIVSPLSRTGGADVSPLEPSPAPGEYFPQMPPTFTAGTQPTIPVGEASSQQPSTVTAGGPANPLDFYTQQQPSPVQAPIPPPSAPRPPSHPQMLNSVSPAVPPAFIPQPAPAPAFIPPQPAPVPTPGYGQQTTDPSRYRRDDDSMVQATKHAKWAISALNFDDVDTAVRELRIALQALGAA